MDIDCVAQSIGGQTVDKDQTFWEKDGATTVLEEWNKIAKECGRVNTGMVSMNTALNGLGWERRRPLADPDHNLFCYSFVMTQPIVMTTYKG